MIKETPFHPRTSALNETGLWSHWSGYLATDRYQMSDKFEYFAIRNSAAVIDTSPLYKYRIYGKDAEKYLAGVLTRDIRKCRPGQAHYTAWSDDDGWVIEDGVILRLSDDEFLLTAAEPNLAYLQGLTSGMSVAIEDVSDEYGALALQGPYSREILKQLAPEMEGIGYFHLTPAKIGNAAVTISRTGYTGDLGYEIWMPNEAALSIWDGLMEAGAGYGIAPVGILAMDMARVEAGLFMIEVDYTSTSHAWIEAQKSSPFELGLDWTVALDKPGYFVGRRALEREKREGSAWRLMGLEVEWEGMERLFKDRGLPPQIPGMAVRGSLPIMFGNVQVGYASTSSWSPLLKKYIALAHLQRPYYEVGTSVRLEITVEHQRQYAPARVVKLPFYEPEWKKK